MSCWVKWTQHDSVLLKVQYIIIKRKKVLISYLIKILYASLFLFLSNYVSTLVWYLGTEGELQLWQRCTHYRWPLFSLRARASPFIFPIRAASHGPHRQTLLRNYAKYKFTMNNEYSCINAVLTAVNHTC